MEYKVKPLDLHYVDEVCRMEEEAFSMPWHKESFIEMINHPDACYLVTVEVGPEGERVVAGCGLRDIVGEGEITNVVTDVPYRGRGIAGKMLKVLLEEGKKRGIEAFTLEVRKSNLAAIRLYESLGFKEEGIRKNFYEKPTEDALIMWKR